MNFHLKIDAFLFKYKPWGWIEFCFGKCLIIGRLFCWIWKCFYVLDGLYFCHHKRHIVQNLFQKLSILKTECSSSEIWDYQWQIIQCNTIFYHLDLAASFSNYQNTSMLLFYFWLFFIFSYGCQCPCDQLSNFSEHYFS